MKIVCSTINVEIHKVRFTNNLIYTPFTIRSVAGDQLVHWSVSSALRATVYRITTSLYITNAYT